MPAPLSETFETVAPTEADTQLARESSRRLAARRLGRRASVRIQVLDDGEEVLQLPQFHGGLIRRQGAGMDVVLIRSSSCVVLRGP